MYIEKIGWILSLLAILGAVLIVLKKDNAGFLLISYVTIPLLTFLLLVTRMNVSLHYLIFTLPAYALLASCLLIEIIKKIKSEVDQRFHSKTLKNIQINEILSIGVVLSILLFGLPAIPRLSNYYEYGVHPDWKAACLFVESRIKPNDVVVSTAFSPVDYYLGRFDYELIEAYFGRIKNSKWRVWLFVDAWRIDVVDPDHEFRDWLTSHCKLMHQVRLIEIYLFDPQEFN